ncbi:MAG: hypothetical protein AAGB03_00185 [Pseudomonadota bacterium]
MTIKACGRRADQIWWTTPEIRQLRDFCSEATFLHDMHLDTASEERPSADADRDGDMDCAVVSATLLDWEGAPAYRIDKMWDGLDVWYVALSLRHPECENRAALLSIFSALESRRTFDECSLHYLLWSEGVSDDIEDEDAPSRLLH